MKISFHRPDLPPYLNDLYSDSIKNGGLTTGKKVAIFEYKLSSYLGEHVVVVNSCTAALHLSIASKGFEKGSKYI